MQFPILATISFSILMPNAKPVLRLYGENGFAADADFRVPDTIFVSARWVAQLVDWPGMVRDPHF
jgi:hypothetical protein